MAKGENIYHRKDGRWEARYIRAREPGGKIRYGYCYASTYREAKEKAAIKRKEGAATICCSAPFRHYADHWLEECRIRVKLSTFQKYESILELHLLPALGDQNPAFITENDLNRLVRCLMDQKGLHTKTIQDILMVFQMIMKQASKEEHICLPALKAVLPRETRKPLRVLSPTEQLTLYNYLQSYSSHFAFGVLLALQTGLRIGELCALQWKDINLREGSLSVSRTMQRLRNTGQESDPKTRIVISDPKTSESNRIIPLPSALLQLCLQHQQDKECYILTGSPDYMEPRCLQYRFSRLVSRCDLKGVHFHTLRHTFATRCVEAGMDIKCLSEILGHASVRITLDRYVHPTLEAKRKGMETVEDAFFSNSPAADLPSAPSLQARISDFSPVILQNEQQGVLSSDSTVKKP